MSHYPAYRQLKGRPINREDGLEVTRATNGRLHTRRMWDADKATFDIGHVLTAAERNDLAAFYAAEKNADVSFFCAADGQAYTVRFIAPPLYEPRGRHFECFVKLAEV